MNRPIEAIVAEMPDLVKLTLVGIGIDPPIIDQDQAHPTFLAALDTLVRMGLVVVFLDGRARRYHLSAAGAEAYALISRETPYDGTIIANDDEPDPSPEAA